MSPVLDVSLPVFAIILCGFVAGKSGILGSQSASALNGFVFYFALPALLFGFTAQAPISVLLNWPFIGAVVGASAVTYALASIAGRVIFGHRLPLVCISGLSGVFANTGYLGIPLFLAAFGADNTGPAIVATFAVNAVFVGGTIALMEYAEKKSAAPFRMAGQILWALFRNPLVSAPVLGLPFALLSIQFPSPAVRFLDLMGSAAGPAALFAIGLSFVDRTVRAQPGEIGVFIIIKLIVHPILVWIAVTYIFSMGAFWASSAIILAALPTAAVTFVMARERNLYVSEVSSIIVVTTIISVATISMLLVVLPF